MAQWPLDTAYEVTENCIPLALPPAQVIQKTRGDPYV
jgi:hypothetical protein